MKQMLNTDLPSGNVVMTKHRNIVVAGQVHRRGKVGKMSIIYYDDPHILIHAHTHTHTKYFLAD